LVGLSELATQHALEPRQFVCLTATGASIFAKLRPIDELRLILEARQKQGGAKDDSALLQFFKSYGTMEACAMCLIIATTNRPLTGPLPTSSHALKWTGGADFPSTQPRALPEPKSALESKYESKYDGMDGFGSPPPLDELGKRGLSTPSRSLVRAVDVPSPYRDVFPVSLSGEDDIRPAARTAYFQLGAEGSRMMHGTSMASVVSVVPDEVSGRHDGLVLYVSRILRSVWDWSVVEPAGQKQYVRLRFSREQLVELRSPLLQVRAFFEQNKDEYFRDPLPVANGVNGAGALQPMYPNIGGAANTSQKEQDGLRAIHYLIQITSEAFNLLVLFAEQPNFPKLAIRLKPEELEKLLRINFADLVTFVGEPWCAC